jgi:hypothetical protein
MLQRNNTRVGIEARIEANCEVQDSQANDMDEDIPLSESLGNTHNMALHDKDNPSSVAARRQATWSANSAKADWAVACHRYISFLRRFHLQPIYVLVACRDSRISLSQPVAGGGAKRTRASESLSQPDPACASHMPSKQAKFGHQRSPLHGDQESGSPRQFALTAEVMNHFHYIWATC